MSKDSKKFGVPDELANLYDFANSLDVRYFSHHGVPHRQGDELGDARELSTWMSQRGLLSRGEKVTAATLSAALRLRAGVRAYLQCDAVERRKNNDAVGSLNEAMAGFPLVVGTRNKDGLVLQDARRDGAAGLAVIVAELYDGSRNGTLNRLKMCAAEECRRVFFDRSKPATRRWCMSTLCGNRMKTRAYRERHRNVE